MKLTPYKDAIKMAKEKIDEALAPARTRKAKKQAELEIAKLDERIATIQAEIEEETSKKDLNFECIIDKLDTLGLAERKLKQFEKIILEMFPDE